MREILSNRRETRTFAFQQNGHRFTASVGLYPDGRAAEIFIDTEKKAATGMANMALDLAVVASLALQYGCPLETLRAAFTQLDDGSPAGPLGAAFEHFVAMG